jgi:hypothetical protein
MIATAALGLIDAEHRTAAVQTSGVAVNVPERHSAQRAVHTQILLWFARPVEAAGSRERAYRKSWP